MKKFLITLIFCVGIVLTAAAQVDRKDVIQNQTVNDGTLLIKKVNPKMGTYLSDEFLLLALENKHFKTAEDLIEKGIDVNTAFQSVPTFNLENDLDVVKFFIEHGVDINTKIADKNNATILMLTENPELVKYLLVNNAKTYLIDDNNKTALWYACSQANPEKVKLLLEGGLKGIEMEKLSVYLYDAVVSHPENPNIPNIIKVAEILFDNDAIYKNYYFIPYINALINFTYRDARYKEVFELIYNKKHEYFLKCVSNHETNLVIELLEQGVDPNFEYKGETALSIAKKKKYKDIYDILIQYGALD